MEVTLSVRPVLDLLYVELEQEQKGPTGLIISISDRDPHAPRRGTVLAVGPGRPGADGYIVDYDPAPNTYPKPAPANVGDVVLFHGHCGRRSDGEDYEFDGHTIRILQPTDILGIIAPAKASTAPDPQIVASIVPSDPVDGAMRPSAA